MGRINKILVNNWSLKLLALILAAISFYAIRGTTSFTILHDIPLVVDVELAGITVLEQPETIRVTFRGSQEDLGRLDPKRILAIVHPEVSNPTGTEVVSIGRGDIDGASGVLVEKIEPSSVSLSFDREIVRKFSVAKPKTRGTPLRGRVELEFEPDAVMVRGSERRLEEVEKQAVETEPVDVDGRVESFVSRSRVLPPSPTGLWRIEPSEVTVRVNIVTETISRQWTNVAILAVVEHGEAADVTFDPEAVNVSLIGRAEVVNGVSGSSLKVFVDCVGLKTPGSYELPVNVHLPAGMEVTASVEPEVVKVIMKEGGGI